MTIKEELLVRAKSKCELCNATDELDVFEVPPTTDGSTERCVLLCASCRDQIETPANMDVHHWRCLNDSCWSAEPGVQVMAWRMLKRLSTDEGWARDLLDSLYLEEEVLAWAMAAADEDNDENVIHKDANGAVLKAGDTITLIKDLNVKGAGFTAKRGTAVRNISLVTDNPEQIEGRVNGQQIVILTQFVKKSG